MFVLFLVPLGTKFRLGYLKFLFHKVGFIAINFTLRTAFVASHTFLVIVFPFSFTYRVFFKLIYLLLAVIGLHDWVDFPLVAESGVYSSLWCLDLPWWPLLWCRRALGAWGFSRCSSWAPEHRFNSCGATKLLQGMWDLPGQGTESVSHALASRFFTTELPGNSYLQFFFFFFLF